MADQDDSRTKDGLKTALAALGPGDPPAETAEQLPLLPLEGAEGACGQGAGNSGGPGGQAAPRGPGRPAGAKNKRTKEMVDYLLSKYRSPLEVLASTYSMSVGDLAKELRCDRLDAFKLQLSAARELAPYVHQRLPQAVELTGDGAVPVVFHVTEGQAKELLGGDLTGAFADGLVIDAEVVNSPDPAGLEAGEEDDENSGT